MANNIRQLFSKKKRRFEEGDFSLDLSYITPHVIAMGVPAETFERVYRNDINQVARFLETRHPNRYKVYNLCVERTYNIGKFKERVELYPIHDHNPPLIHTIPYFCKSVHNWLSQDTDYVVAIHCKAGKGRTGVMICCYLLYQSYVGLHSTQPTYLTAEQVLKLYDQQRTHDNKGVTIPSQRRYVYYYSHMLSKQLTIEDCGLTLKSVTIEGGPPTFPPGGTCCLMFKCKKMVRNNSINNNNCQQYNNNNNNNNNNNKSTLMPIGESDCFEPKRGDLGGGLIIKPPRPIPVKGDIKLVFYNRLKKIRQSQKVFHFWLNTFFVLHQPEDTPGAKWRQLLANGGVASAAPAPDDNYQRDIYLTLTKQELDGACKDLTHKIYPADFAVTLQFGLLPTSAGDANNCTAQPLRSFSLSPLLAADSTDSADATSLSSASSCSNSDCELLLQHQQDEAASSNSNNNNSDNNSSNNNANCYKDTDRYSSTTVNGSHKPHSHSHRHNRHEQYQHNQLNHQADAGMLSAEQITESFTTKL